MAFIKKIRGLDKTTFVLISTIGGLIGGAIATQTADTVFAWIGVLAIGIISAVISWTGTESGNNEESK